MAEKKFEILQKQILHDGFFQTHKYRLRFTKYNGDNSAEIEREVFERGVGVAILLYDSDREEVVLIEQFRIGSALSSKKHAWMLEIPAGIIENGLSKEQTIIKETHEETGLDIHQVKKIGEYFMSPGGSTEKLYLYFAQICAKEVDGIFGCESEAEDIRVHAVKKTDAFKWVQTGKICNAITVIALQWLQINQNNLEIK